MALTYAANHPEITSVFSIAGTDHGEFVREYTRNPGFQKVFDGVIDSLAAPAGPVRFAEGFTLKKIIDMGVDAYYPNLDLRKGAPLLAEKDILLICGWDDSKQAWLLKNCWGTDWGENGFMWIEYNCNRVGEGANYFIY